MMKPPVRFILLAALLCNLSTFGNARCNEPVKAASPQPLRIATFNVSLYGQAAGQLAAKLKGGNDRQAKSLAAIIQKVRPDILLLNEIDYSPDAAALKTFLAEYLSVSQHDLQPIEYRYLYSPPSNTGMDSSLDLNANGQLHEANDCWGYGTYPGQYSFAILSRYPIDEASTRTFQKYLWSQLPGALKPIVPSTQKPYFNEKVWEQLRLSSKNHVDVSVHVNGTVVHILASHPTPPVFDGPEDRNGCRNHDEIIFWKHYLDDNQQVIDDTGRKGGLSAAASFVILGDLNSDQNFGDSRPEAIRTLLNHPRVRSTKPRRSGADDTASDLEALDTAAFSAGEARVDYVLPSADFNINDSQVFWPAQGSPGEPWIHASDHRMVWIDAILPQASSHSTEP